MNFEFYSKNISGAYEYITAIEHVCNSRIGGIAIDFSEQITGIKDNLEIISYIPPSTEYNEDINVVDNLEVFTVNPTISSFGESINLSDSFEVIAIAIIPDV